MCTLDPRLISTSPISEKDRQQELVGRVVFCRKSRSVLPIQDRVTIILGEAVCEPERECVHLLQQGGIRSSAATHDREQSAQVVRDMLRPNQKNSFVAPRRKRLAKSVVPVSITVRVNGYLHNR